MDLNVKLLSDLPNARNAGEKRLAAGGCLQACTGKGRVSFHTGGAPALFILVGRREGESRASYLLYKVKGESGERASLLIYSLYKVLIRSGELLWKHVLR